MRPRRVILWVAATLAILIGLALGFYRFILDWNGRPYTHATIYLAFVTTMHDSGDNFANDLKPFPNVKGLSQDSLATLREAPPINGNMDWATNYNYVPGLREGDPGDLVLMYFNRPTRWSWSAEPPTIFKDKKWIIIPVDFEMGMAERPNRVPGYAERVSLDEFRSRLSRTLEFIRTNERPNWQTVVAEHEKFLASLENDIH